MIDRTNHVDKSKKLVTHKMIAWWGIMNILQDDVLESVCQYELCFKPR